MLNESKSQILLAKFIDEKIDIPHEKIEVVYQSKELC